MKKAIFNYIIRSLLLSALILIFEIRLANGEITFRNIEINKSTVNNVKVFEYDICYKGKSSVLVDMKNEPLLVIPDNQIANISLSYNSCIDTSDVELKIDIREGFRDLLKRFTSEFVNKQAALFINGDLVSASRFFMPLEIGIRFGCLSYEKAVAIIINSGFTPNYEETCVGGKTKMIDLTGKYKFKENYTQRKNFYSSSLNNSEFWYLKEETLIYDKPDGNIIARMPAKKIVEQHYNPESKEFEKKGDWLKIIYQGETDWIKLDNAIPLFSTLDTNLFLQQFFIYNEYRYEGSIVDKHMYSSYLINRLISIRKLYIAEALQRFKDEKEFKRWYIDTFGKEFAAKYLKLK
jgi:hypothetical protein